MALQKYLTILLSAVAVSTAFTIGEEKNSGTTDFEDQKLSWISIDEARSNMSLLIPSGIDLGRLPSYVARAEHLGEWVPGKAILGEAGDFYMYFSYEGQEHMRGDFQLLRIPIGVSSWVPSQRGEFHRLSVVAGQDPITKEATHICRGWYDNGKLFMGRLL
ncbi:unnamed protein product [Orchesella dallaii]|uniref:Uncharacterized protein n=1 Tax=Orchesella dallaii TaxID=48710 RepID=A0ABP1RJJ7_9HEXA